MKAPRSLISSPKVAIPQGSTPDNAYRQSRSPYRFLSPHADEFDEKDICESAELSALRPSTSASAAPCIPRSPRRSRPSTPIIAQQQHTYGYPSSTPLPPPCTLSHRATPTNWDCLIERVRPWIPLGLWVATSLGFLLAIAFWRTEVFQRLDEFSHWLQAQDYGYAVLFLLIFITTIPPFPLYSTFMTLSGYCFGAMTGAVISYTASLTGAVVVFLLSRAYCSEWIGTMFERAPSMKRVIRAIEKRPNILFLIRLAPYPFNVMNVLLAASPTLTLRTYTTCTALSLLKVIVHTSLGASIHSFSHTVAPADGVTDPTEPEDSHDVMSKVWTGIGIALCVGVFIYITIVARRAVDGELEDDCSEERVAFLQDDGQDQHDQEMSEATVRDSRAQSRPVSRMATFETDGPSSTDTVAPIPRTL
ncbi:hypothetical protein EXIGLDRAFT_599836 [Exidia glandulosa HHB12029]|uniref:Golgi apparatus membrane protein TVP38 n=1 Tax=Exidia glandulosa HHB12029 TaxID=1314781 RepID=A0A165QPA1_EXIGL|nr:hypothetical protein EXIGLDRAFT_599836 [Exidia glandulosa HHB12029]